MDRMARTELLLEIAELDILFRLERKVDWIMAEIDDLNAGVANLQAAAASAIAKIDALKAAPAGVDPAAVAAAATAVQAVADSLNAAAA